MYNVRFGFSQSLTKNVEFDTEETAKRFFDKVIRFMDKHNLVGTVALWNGKWLVKSYKN